MATPEGKRLAQFARSVRESTLGRLQLVPVGMENWHPSPGALSFADIAQHLVDCDNWLFKKLDVKDLAPIKAEAGRVQIGSRKDFNAILDELKRVGKQRSELIANATESKLSETLFDERFDGEVSTWWVILRGNLDHEIHHRGQLTVYLGIIKPQTPPM